MAVDIIKPNWTSYDGPGITICDSWEKFDRGYMKQGTLSVPPERKDGSLVFGGTEDLYDATAEYEVLSGLDTFTRRAILEALGKGRVVIYPSELAKRLKIVRNSEQEDLGRPPRPLWRE